jgi:DNA-binding transcriptional LysR family regulator
MMDDLNAMALYVKVVEAGSMAAAARLTGLPKSTVSRRVAELEKDLGAALLHRSTRTLNMTDSGRIYFDRVWPVVRTAEQAAVEVRSRNARAVGLVRISATIGFGQGVLAPVLCQILSDEPELRIELRLTEERMNIIRDGLDLAIRMGALEDAELLSRKIATVARVLCASPAYLAAHEAPQKPDDLKGHSCIVTAADLNRWRFADGQEIDVPWRFAAGNVFMAHDAAVGGQGIALLPRYLVREALLNGQLIEILPEFPIPHAAATAIYPRDRVLSLATKIVLDRMAATLGRETL